MVTVLMPSRAGKPPTWETKRTEEKDVIAVTVTVDGRTHTIRFPQPGMGGAVEVRLAAVEGKRAAGE
jgi:hypothetical protein